MADIVVFDTTKVGDTAQRQSGMKLLGEIFNAHFMDTTLTPDKVVNMTIQDIITNYPDYRVTYKGDTNVMSIDSLAAGTYIYQPGPPTKKVKLKAKKDADDSGTDVMTIALSEGHSDLLLPNNYLSKVIDDLGATDSGDRRKYLLGTITFRRCR
ncbi:hypothetical protein [Cypionkella psychrotolerans]|uniref:hypothetical protein n=1 Tax=Cypionkella psychrotolerans TaxID=1678131 RepID=UPI0006B518E6|nr:hypothetical protein [Cypionkella psychrotolerans]